jgi:hypothetical protein
LACTPPELIAMSVRPVFWFVVAGAISLAAPALAGFQFSDAQSLDDMRSALRHDTPLGTSRSSVRQMLVNEGGATMIEHPERANIEKYVHDINLCSLYVWRWNISANYDDAGNLTQIFINGEPVLNGGEPARGSKQAPKKAGAKQAILKVWRSRPEARLGENKLAFVLYDLDTATNLADDEFIIGAGPSRADPSNFGKMHVYRDVERWRSIFDQDAAKTVVDFAGACPG